MQKTFPENQLIEGHGIRHEVEALIMKDYPDWSDHSWICKEDFDTYWMEYIVKMIEEEKGSIDILEEAVIRSIKENDILTIKNDFRPLPPCCSCLCGSRT